MSRRGAIVVSLALGCSALGSIGAPVRAVYPGANGRVVFMSTMDPGPDPEIFSMKPDGTDVKQLTENDLSEGYPCVSPDGSEIAFSADVLADSEIFTMPVDGNTDPVQLTENESNDFDPCWSPNGQKLIYWSATGESSFLQKMDASGGNPVQITPTNGHFAHPVWSVTGRIAADRNAEIVTLKPDGSDVKRLTHNDVTDFLPDWSPDGKKIVFTTIRGSNYDAIVVDADGSHRVNVTHTDKKAEARAVWSPDGRRIAFNQDFAPKGVPESDVMTIRADGTDRRNLTGYLDAVDAPSYEYWPDWQSR